MQKKCINAVEIKYYLLFCNKFFLNPLTNRGKRNIILVVWGIVYPHSNNFEKEEKYANI